MSPVHELMGSGPHIMHVFRKTRGSVFRKIVIVLSFKLGYIPLLR